MENKVEFTEEEKKLKSKLEKISSRFKLAGCTSLLASSINLPAGIIYGAVTGDYDTGMNGITLNGFIAGCGVSILPGLGCIVSEGRLVSLYHKKIGEYYARHTNG